MKPFIIILVILTASGVLLADEAEPLAPTYSDLPYGPDPMNVLDFWKATGIGPRPLLVYIHGGGWVGGDKKRTVKVIRPFLDKGSNSSWRNCWRRSNGYPMCQS